MGMAASQARFLGLTARKSNVEYQGQQINQARTALSNKVNGLYNKYNALKVPTPPLESDYTKLTMKVQSADEDYSIAKYEKITDTTSPYYGYYNLSMNYDEQIAQVYSNTVKNSVITATGSNGNYTKLNFTLGTDTYKYEEGGENNTITKIDTEDPNFDASKYAGLEEVIKYNKEKSGSSSRYYYMYTNTASSINYYESGKDLDDTAWTTTESGEKTYSGAYSFQYQGSTPKTESISAVASITQDSDGRLTGIKVVACSDDPTLVGNTYSVNTTSSKDNDGYQDAMNKYYYKKDLYENEVEKINKETEKIQTEDKSLELKLNQLDTEQDALKTEIESVQKVIEDTIKSVFKTYSS